LTGVIAVSAGGSGFACALLTGGTVDCWGASPGATTPSGTPAPVSGLTGATAISAGLDFACALVTGGTVECWGGNVSGQLGNGSITDSSTPVVVIGLTGATAVSAGAEAACAVLTGGTVECWGNNSAGQLGNGSMTNSSTPVVVTGLTGATAVSAGGGSEDDEIACALLTGGTVECWGFDDDGELGNGSMTFSSGPVTVTGLTGATAVSVTVGSAAEETFTCALLTGGTVQCWGQNGLGELGNGSMTGWATPVAVSGLTGATAVSGGADFACAVLSGGTVQCWGAGVADGVSRASSATPVAVSGLTGATAVSAGSETQGGPFACALTGDTVQCWGNDYFSELGNNPSARSGNTPYTVLAP
jgi:alpha-tubulin suppressor-like RCC1 family protein